MLSSFQNSQVQDFPKIEELVFYGINKKYLKVIFSNIFIFFFIAYLGFTIAVFFDFFTKISNYTYLFYVVITFFLLITLFVKYIGFKKRKYAVREKDISYKKGILFKKLTTVPFNRVQHIEVDEGPISRFFSLASLSVYTAGDSSDDLEIKGLSKEKALEIKEFISKKIDE